MNASLGELLRSAGYEVDLRMFLESLPEYEVVEEAVADTPSPSSR